MFDLQYYNKLIKNNYKTIPIVYMLISDEYIMLNDHLARDHKKQILQTKIDNLTEIFKKEELLVYPCSYDEHLKHKNKFLKLIKHDPNIYLFFICKEYKMCDIITASKAPKNVQKEILHKVLSFND
tara:strand:+ start:326 stop:703 length:378 start_codon:yes stop_codon:yes gene_type:complete